ncbi:MAG: AAA family ATPase [Alkalilacustris sp.]
MNMRAELNLTDEAVMWAEAGIPVFPTGEDKRPLTRHGHKDASTDPDTIAEMFAEAGARAHGIGGRMGKDAGLFAIDADLYKPGDAGASAAAFVKGLQDRGLLPETREHRTRNGGAHYLLRSEADWPNVNPASGVEVKGEGGYIILPPTPGYEEVRGGVAVAPAALLAELRAAKSALSGRSIDALKSAVLRGEDFHDPLAQMAAKLAANAQPIERVQAALLETLAGSLAMAPNHPRHDRWRALVENAGGEFSRLVESAHLKFNPNVPSEALREAAGAMFADLAPAPWSDEVAAPDSVLHAGKRRGFKLVRVGDLRPKVPRFLIDGLIEEDAFVLLFGEPGAGKSLVAFDMAASIATGAPFHGRPGRQGPVVVLAGEGHNGLARRFAAWAQHRGQSLAEAPLHISEGAARLLDGLSVEEVKQAVDAIAAEQGAPACILVDTLARNFGPGDENSNKDMSQFVAVLDGLKARYHCTVILVHHSGHGESGRARGASALKAAVDAEFCVRKAPPAGLTLDCTKMKDAAPPGTLAFDIQPVEVPTEDGGTARSAVLVETAVAAQAQAKQLSHKQKLAVRAFHAAQAKQRGDGVEAPRVHLDQWREAFYSISPADGEDAKRKSFWAARRALTDSGVAVVEDDLYALTGEFARPDDAAFFGGAAQQ